MQRKDLYAYKTKVATVDTRGEIERVLKRFGADEFGFTVTRARAQIGFRMHDRVLRFTIPTEGGANVRNQEAELRRRWRTLLLAIKSKLESVASGLTTFEEEFLSHIVIPGDGRTIGEAIAPQLAEIYETRKAPNLLEGT